MKIRLIAFLIVACLLCCLPVGALTNAPGGGINFNVLDAGDRGCGAKGQCSDGMVTWAVSLPYVNLWLADAPVSYTTSLGEKISFELFYKQRDTTPPHTNAFQPWFLRSAATPGGVSSPEPRPFVPATGWNHNWFSYIRFSGLYNLIGGGFTNDWQDFGSWHATLFVPGGGTIDFNSASSYLPTDVPNNPNLTQADLQPMIVYEAGTGLGPIYPCTTNVLQGGLDVAGHIGFRLVHADGSMDLYGKVTPLYPNTAVADALWTEHIDPYGNSLHFYYTNVTISGVSSYLLSHVVDYDGETNYLTYNSSNLLSRVDMPYGRHATFAYDPSGNLTNITDALGMPSTMSYQTNAFGSVEPASVTTAYGTTSFELFDRGSTQGTNHVGNMGGTNRINRAIRVTHPDLSKELFAYRFDSSALGFSNSVTDATSPFGKLDNSFDGGNTNLLQNLSALYTRNSFHWGRRQYSLVSTSDIDLMTANDYRLATMTHWLARDANTLSDSPSMIQQPSPDGISEGARVWFDDSSKNSSTPWIAGNGANTVVCQLLPDGQTRYAITSRNASGLPVSVESTYELPDGQLSTRTINYSYETLTGSVTCETGGNQIASQSWTYYALSSVNGPGWETHFSSHNPETTTYSIGSYDFELIRPIRRELTVTDAENQTSTIWYNDRQQWTGARLVNGVYYTNYYDASGWPAQTVNLSTGATNAIAFADGLPLFRTNAVGLWTSYAWDELQRPLSVIFPDGTGYTNQYDRLNLDLTTDRLGHPTDYTANSMGQVTDIVDAKGRHTEFSYCSCGSLETITDPVNGATTHNYDNAGRFISKVDSDGFATVYNRNRIGQVTNVADSAGNSVSVDYNHQGRVKRVSNSAGMLYQVVYDIHDRPFNVINAYGASVTNTYDNLGRLLTRKLVNGSVTSVDTYSYTTNGLESHTDAEQRVTTYGYDSGGRLFAVTNANQEVVSATFNKLGQMRTLTDGRNKTTGWLYDVYGRMIAETNANGVIVRTNAYDANGQVTRTWTPAKGLVFLNYDAVGNLTNLVSSNRTMMAVYDSLDRLTSITDNAGTVSRTYSSFGAFKGALATENGPWANDTYTIHRLSSRLTDYATLEELNASGSPTTRTWTFDYDALNRLNELSGSAGTFTFDYAGPAGRLTTTHLPGGNVSITNFFDPAGQLLERSMRTSSGVLDYFGYTHDLTGLRTNVLRGDNTHVEYLFDGIGQLTNAIAYEPGGGLRQNENFAYAYDGGGNLQTRVNNTLTQSFGVDNANRLTSASRSGTLTAAGSINSLAQSVTVNGVGAEMYVDKTFATTNGLTLNNGNNSLTFSAKNAANQTTSYTEHFNLPTNVNYTYDANGNLISDGSLGYDYDDSDQLVRITKTNTWKSEFVYDALGRRNVRREFTWNSGLGTWNSADEVRYIWIGMSLVQERDSNNAVKVTYTGKLARTDANGTAYYFSDGNRNVTSLIDSSGNFKAKYRYDSFGNLLSMSGPLADANLIRFSGKEYHPRSGLYYYGFRYYQPNLQRWLNEDPIGRRGGLNLHRFVGNNPINSIDPHGLALLSWMCGQGWSGDAADAFEESIGESMMEQAAEMAAGADVIRQDGWGARDLMIDEMSDRYADMMVNYGEANMYLIAANDVTGGTALMEGLNGIDLQSQTELTGEESLQRGLMGGGQVLLSATAGASMVNSARAGYAGTGFRAPTQAATAEAAAADSAAAEALANTPPKAPIAPVSSCPIRNRSGIQRGVDPNELRANARRDFLYQDNLNDQLELIDSGIARKDLIIVNPEGIIYDGTHGVRAAIERGKLVDVQILDLPMQPGLPVKDLPIVPGSK